MQELEELIEYHNHLYYDLSKSEISDREFDALLARLVELEKQYPNLASPHSPTQRVGGTVTREFASVTHKRRMYSLDNTYDYDELSAFIRRIKQNWTQSITFVCEPKIDGVAISLIYKKGILHQAITRGDGIRGDEVTANVKTIRSIPLRLKGNNWPEEVELRGEIFMRKSVFEKLNKQLWKQLEEQGLDETEIRERLYKNPRNTTSGTLKLQNSAEVARRKLDAFIYCVLQDDNASGTQAEDIEHARVWGFQVPEVVKVCKTEEEIRAHIEWMDHWRHTVDYDTDGVVLKVNEKTAQQALGYTAKSPRWAVAYKFQTEQAETRLLGFDFQVGRTGAITPVANLKPVELGGTTVKRASVHNADFIRHMDLRIGDSVFVEKGGEIIPKIVGVNMAERPENAVHFEFPTHCPECGTELIRKPGEAQHYCPNDWSCRPQQIGKLVHFVSRKAMNIDSLGEKTIALFYDLGWVKRPSDFYELIPEQIMNLEGFKEKSAENIVQGIAASRQTPFPRVLFALGIRHVGETVAQRLARHYENLENLRQTDLETLIAIPDIGPVIAESVWQWLKNEDQQAEVDKLVQAGLCFSMPVEKRDGPRKFEGKTFVISGVFQTYSREGLKEIIEDAGGKVSGSVSKNTDYLVAGENMGPAKLQKATSLGVKIISETEFTEMLHA